MHGIVVQRPLKFTGSQSINRQITVIIVVM
jgi:hypothetical protein